MPQPVPSAQDRATSRGLSAHASGPSKRVRAGAFITTAATGTNVELLRPRMCAGALLDFRFCPKLTLGFQLALSERQQDIWVPGLHRQMLSADVELAGLPQQGQSIGLTTRRIPDISRNLRMRCTV
jgi:hypothetical protein